MRYLAAALHTLGVRLSAPRSRSRVGERERGAVTIEQVLWAVAMIAIVGVVVAAITAYVTSKAGQLR